MHMTSADACHAQAHHTKTMHAMAGGHHKGQDNTKGAFIHSRRALSAVFKP